MSPLSSGMEGSAARVAQYGSAALAEGLPALLKVLQAVAAIHPFLQVAVGTFMVAVELDLKRRENDKKINLLFGEMRDMMSVLAELQFIDRPSHVGTDGKTIQERLQSLVDSMAEDIRQCANACDAYAKRNIVSKVLLGPKWDDVLERFIKQFNKRRADIEFALAIHLGVNIDLAHRKLDNLDNKVDRVIALLHQSASPEQRDLSAFVDRRGGSAAFIADEQLFASIYRERQDAATPTVKSPRRQTTLDYQAFRAHMLDDPDIAIANNMETFERKFKIQQVDLAEEIRGFIHHHGDLVIKAVTAGPHDRIVHPDLRNIWQEMKWRGNVKARHFVLALRDYCVEKLDKRQEHETFSGCENGTEVTLEDEWTLEYINVTRLQAIIEAFDDDASGFITVGEANAFAASRPMNWSLLKWMAYWAVGWQMAMTHYITRIDTLLAKMFAIKTEVLPANRRFIDYYLDRVWSWVTELTTGFRRAEWSDAMRDRFQGYVAEEEVKMRHKLDLVRHDIDAADTLLLIIGTGRVEKHLFILLYLLLERDFEIFRLARSTILHKDELWDSANTLEWVYHAVDDRHRDLENLFKQQNRDPAEQFKVFAFELFNYWHDSTPLWSFDRLRESRYVDVAYTDSEENPTVDPASILNHPLDIADDPLTLPDYVETDADRGADSSLHAILGHWCGFVGRQGLSPSEPMLSLDLHAATAKPGHFVASGSTSSGTRWTLVGEAKSSPDKGDLYSFTVTFAARLWPRSFEGALTDDGRIFSGTWSSKSNSESGSFLLKRLPCDVMRFWPNLSDRQSKSKALWTFAIRAVIDRVRRNLWSRTWIEERQRARQRYLRIIRDGDADLETNESEIEAIQRCYLSMTPVEARYYHTLHDYQQQLAPKHYGVTCSHCHATIAGARYICLDCHVSRSTLDLCERPECLTAVIGPDRRVDLPSPHLPSHRLLKLRRVIHRHREFGGVYRAAHDALIRAEEALSDVHAVQSWETDAELEHHNVSEGRRLTCIGCHAGTAWNVTVCPLLSACTSPLELLKWLADDVFVCASCEAKNIVIKGAHKMAHGLVLCQQQREEAHAETGHPGRLDVRMTSLEAKIDAIRQDSAWRFDALDRKVDGLNGSVPPPSTTTGAHAALHARMDALDTRMQNIETLLSVLLKKIG
ncbi:hypothetical protein L226DRAFT_548402 [Lentinus tigrinus ALCF2SS1-7]|uniref:EF-hand domain-containing protein n=1 Tax=Lentinus tigrinus ALCF2SS1-6 TaxID=1328759 RepID=A0A5C2S676_9APHY|nr:hypothetical protein L227DRAFT_586580 [Lentinus tigrinus ALCF2SS1-6]RPD68736.1 hypothetical protein L226DRAFT_548402 [Lentinus tigrinus ALCF2SS1-7]